MGKMSRKFRRNKEKEFRVAFNKAARRRILKGAMSTDNFGEVFYESFEEAKREVASKPTGSDDGGEVQGESDQGQEERAGQEDLSKEGE